MYIALYTVFYSEIFLIILTYLSLSVHTHTCPLLGEDGPSQMALEDFAMFRSVAGSVCFYPSDAVSCERAIELAANYKGVTFTRTSRPATAVIYKNDEVFEIGKGKVSLVVLLCV